MFLKNKSNIFFVETSNIFECMINNIVRKSVEHWSRSDSDRLRQFSGLPLNRSPWYGIRGSSNHGVSLKPLSVLYIILRS